MGGGMPILRINSADFELRVPDGLIPLKIAESNLGVSRSRLLAVANGSDLTLVKVDVNGTTVTGLTADSFHKFSEKQKKRKLMMQLASASAVRLHIENRLVRNGFIVNGQCLEYNAQVMVPFGLSYQTARDREHMGIILGEVGEETYADPECGAFLSAVVVNKTGPLKGRPSVGFWNMIAYQTGEKFGVAAVGVAKQNQFWKGQIRDLQKYILKLSTSRPIVDLELRVRTNNCLRAENINIVGDLVKLSVNDLLKVPNLGRKALNEISEVLTSRGLTFDMEL
jgi:hypothetical protein